MRPSRSSTRFVHAGALAAIADSAAGYAALSLTPAGAGVLTVEFKINLVAPANHKSIERPEALVPDAVNKYEIPFPASDHVFRAGHRIMVQVQSTWFPVIDPNPQRFVPNIFAAADADFRPATQRIYRSGDRASYIALPVVSR